MLFGKKHKEFLRGLALLKSFDDKEIGALDDVLKERALDKRETLFSAGDPGDAAYIILSGRISVQVAERSGRIREVATLNQGDMLGQVALFDPGPRSATCVADAHQGAVVLELRHEKFENAVTKGHTYGYKLLDVLSRVLVKQFRDTNERLTNLAASEQAADVPRSPGSPEIEALFGDIQGRMHGVAHNSMMLDFE